MSDFLKNLGSSLGTGLFGLLSSAVSARGQREVIQQQLAAQREENRLNRSYNLMLARLQNSWNIDQWQRENDYNSPSAMVQRLREAGLNPNLALSGGTLGSLRSASSPELTSGAPSSPIDTSGLLSQRTFGDALIHGLSTSLAASSAAANFASAKKQSQEAETEKYGTDVMRSKAAFSDALNSGAVRLQDAEIVLKGKTSELTEQQREVAYYEAKYFSQKVEESKAVMERELASIRQADEKIQIEAFRAALESETVKAQVAALAAQTRMTEQEIYIRAMKLPLELTNLKRQNLLLGWKGITERQVSRSETARADQLELEFSVNESMAEWRKSTEIATDMVDIGTSISREVREWYSTYTGSRPSVSTTEDNIIRGRSNDGTIYENRVRQTSKHKK